MSEKKGVVVEIRHEGDKGQIFMTGAKSLPRIYFDFADLDTEEVNAEHLGARLLLCAALACYSNTFRNNLIAGGAKAPSLKGRAAIRKEKDDILRTRYTQINLELEVGLDDADEAVFERVRSNMERGSLLTYSLEEGIELEYDVRKVKAD